MIRSWHLFKNSDGVSIFIKLKLNQEMVEDGHISDSYQYAWNNYYLEDLGKNRTNNSIKNNDTSNNNDTYVVVVDPWPEQSTDDEASEHQNFKNTSNSMATATEVVATAAATPTKTANYCAGRQQCPALMVSQLGPDPKAKAVRSSFGYDKMYIVDANGSSHIDRAPSQTYCNITKEGVRADCGHPREIRKTLIAFCILIFNFFLTTTSLAIIHDKVPNSGPLPDTILDLIVAHEWALNVSEILIVVTTGIMLVIIVLHKCRFIIFRRLFLMLSLLYFMRSITMFVTVLPVSSRSYHCSPQKNQTDTSEVLSRSVKLFMGMGLTINGQHIYCGDYIYSGHTTILVMSYLMISEYSSKKIFWLHWAAWLMSLTGVLMVLISHSHYTVDVIIGYYVTTRLFWMYHTCANNPILKSRSTFNYLSREWWFLLFQYFECNVNGPLQPLEYR